MKKDIVFPQVVGVRVAIVREENDEKHPWQVVLINDNEHAIETITIASRGYGENEGELVETSTLRHFFPVLLGESFLAVELIDPALFSLNNEYWVSYFIGNQVYDKKFIFVPDSITEKHLIFIPMLNKEGVLHS
jgi:hypothetical protein